MVNGGTVFCETWQADGGKDHLHGEDVFARLEEPAEKTEGAETGRGRAVEGKTQTSLSANLIFLSSFYRIVYFNCTFQKEEAVASSEPPTKRGRIEDNGGDEAMDTDESGSQGKEEQAKIKKGDVQLCLKFFMQRNAKQPESSSLEMEVQFLDGEVGKDGVHQIIQYIVNKNKGI